MVQSAFPAEKLLGIDHPAPVGLRNENATSPFLLLCDHAGNAVPSKLQNLGLPSSELDRHIGYDIGILGVSGFLSDLLAAPLVFQRYSRLVVECNRVATSRDSIALISDGTAIPGNIGLDELARAKRHAEIAQPYHREIVSRLEDKKIRVYQRCCWQCIVSHRSFWLSQRPGLGTWDCVLVRMLGLAYKFLQFWKNRRTS